MGHLQDFLSFVTHERYSISKPFLYDVQLNWPTGSELSNDQKTMLRLLCHAAEVPGFDVMTKPNLTYGITYEVPYELQQLPVGLTFYVDKQYEIPKLLKSIKESTFNSKDYSPKYRRDYQFDGTIFVYDLNNMTQVAQYTLINAFIKGVSAMNLAYNAMDSVQTVSLELVYEEITSSFMEGVGSGISSGLPPNDTGFTQNTYEQVPGYTSNIPLNFETFETINPSIAQQFSLTPQNINIFGSLPNTASQLASMVGGGGGTRQIGLLGSGIANPFDSISQNGNISIGNSLGNISNGNGLGNLSGLGTRGFVGGGSDRIYNNIDAIRSAFGIM